MGLKGLFLGGVGGDWVSRGCFWVLGALSAAACLALWVAWLAGARSGTMGGSLPGPFGEEGGKPGVVLACHARPWVDPLAAT